MTVNEQSTRQPLPDRTFLKTTPFEAVPAVSRRDDEVYGRLLDLLLSDCDLHVLLTEARLALGGPLQVRASDGRPLATVGEMYEPDRAVLTDSSLEAHACRAPQMLPCGTWIAPAVFASDDLGIVLVQPAAPLDADGVRLLRLTAQAVAILLLVERGTELTESRLRDDLLEDLLAGCPSRPSHRLAERARRLGIDLEEPSVVVVARPEAGSHGRATAWAPSYAQRMGGLWNVRDGHLVFLLPGSDAGGAARSTAAELSPRLGQPVTAGAAGPLAALEAVPDAYREALRCLDTLVLLGRVGHTASARELGFIGLLLADDRDIDGFIDGSLGPVLAYDRQRGTELVRTLEAYFEADGSPTAAAARLHLHPNTVSRRLLRITELLGPDWRVSQRAMHIQLALQLLRTRRALQR